MSYSYDQRKRPTRQNQTAPESAPGPDFRALMTGKARPTAAQKGRSIDLDAAIKAKMEKAFGDLSAVKLYESPTVGAAGAEAMAMGNEIAFAPGMTDFSSRSGQERLGHELSHVMSQRSGAVRGEGFLTDPALEARADREGAMAAAGEPVYTGPVTHALSSASPAPSAAGPMQAKRESTVSKEEAAKVKQGDYSGFNKIRPKELKKLTKPKIQEIQSFMNNAMSYQQIAKVYGKTTSDLLNPLTRLAMSEIANSKDKSISSDQKQMITNAMDLMDEQMIVNTVMPVSDQQKENLRQHYRSKGDLKRLQNEYSENGFFKYLLGEESMSPSQVDTALYYQERSEEEVESMVQNDVQHAEASGESMMKLLLLMQMGNFTKTTKDKKNGTKKTSKWDRSMANALSHGGRISFLFDASKRSETQPDTVADTDSIFSRIFGQEEDGRSSIQSRSAATHRLLTPKVGQGLLGYKEEHGNLAAIRGKTDSGFHNYGMDMSIGGAGNKGVQGEGGVAQVITTDGRSGHMYVGSRDSTDSVRGGMLVGMETESPYRTNQHGHMHTAMATSAKLSSTGGLKKDLVGKKFGGRTVDFNGATNEDIILTLDAFTAHLNQLKASGKKGLKEYEELARTLSGERMSQKEMNQLMNKLLAGDKHKERRARLNRARKGVRA